MHVVLEEQRPAGAPRELTEARQRIWAMVEGVEGIRQVEAAVVERQVGTVIQHHLVHGARAAHDVHRHHVAREPALLEALGEPSVARAEVEGDRKSTRLNSSHSQISYAVFCLKKKKIFT